MENKETGKVKLPALGQVGLVVKDLDKTMDYYSSTLGIGPWQVVEIDVPKVTVRNQVYAWRGRVAFARLGPVELELIQVVSGRSIHSEFLEEGREGLHHLGFFVTREERDQIMAELGKRGIGVIQGGRGRVPDSSYHYLDTGKVGGMLIELIHRPSE